jgi:small subunit ribosomal protein S20
LANTASAKKRARQAERRRARNMALRSRMRTAIKKVRLAVASGDKNAAQQAFREAMSVIDKVASKGIIHKAAAARHKSRLNARVKALVLGSTTAAAPSQNASPSVA